MFNIYQQFTSAGDYTVPGPPLYSGAANGQGSAASATGGSAAAPTASAASKSAKAAGEIGNQDNESGSRSPYDISRMCFRTNLQK